MTKKSSTLRLKLVTKLLLLRERVVDESWSLKRYSLVQVHWDHVQEWREEERATMGRKCCTSRMWQQLCPDHPSLVSSAARAEFRRQNDPNHEGCKEKLWKPLLESAIRDLEQSNVLYCPAVLLRVSRQLEQCNEVYKLRNHLFSRRARDMRLCSKSQDHRSLLSDFYQGQNKPPKVFTVPTNYGSALCQRKDSLRGGSTQCSS